MKKNIIIIIAVLCTIAAVVTTSFFFGRNERNINSDEALHINSDVVRLESDMSKRLSVVSYGDNKNKKTYRLVSENEFVAVCEGDNVNAVNEGETFVYAESSDGKTKSNKVKVIVSNGIFETAAKIIMLANADQYFNKQIPEEVLGYNATLSDKEKESVENVEITKEKVAQITENKEEKVPEIFASPVEKDEKAEKIENLVTGEKKQTETTSTRKETTTEKTDLKSKDTEKEVEKSDLTAKEVKKETEKSDSPPEESQKESEKSSSPTENEEKVPENPEVSTNTDGNRNDMVYITKSGKRFHLKTCSSAKNSTPVTRGEAINRGKTPCQKCKP